MPAPNSATVIGLGPMGSAMAQVLLRNDVAVTVHNRTAARADALVTAGATRADDPPSALRAADLILISLIDYPAMYALLGDATDELSGKVLVNLSSGTPEEVREAARWAADHGATLLAAGIMVPAALVGDPSAYTFVAGDRAALQQHSDVLGLLGKPEYVGADPALAMHWYQAMLATFMITLTGVYQSAAMINKAGVPAKELMPRLSELLASMPYFLADTAQLLDDRRYPDDGASLAMMTAGIDHITRMSESAGIDPTVPAAVRTLNLRAIDMGHAQDGGFAVYEAIMVPGTEERA